MGAGHVIPGGIFHHVDVDALGAQRRRQAAGVVDRLRQRRGSIRIMAICR